MRVLLLSNLFPSMEEPTRGIFNKQIFSAISKHCDVLVVSPRAWWTLKSHPERMFVPKKEDFTGMTASFPAYWTMPRFYPELHGRAMYLSLRNYVGKLRRDFPFDVILAAWAYPDAFAAVKLGHDFNCPVITNLMGSDINELGKYERINSQIKWTLDNSFRVISVSNALKNRVVEMGIAEEKVIVHHNGVNGEIFDIRSVEESRIRLGLPIDRKIIMYIGNMLPVKGTDVLVESMSELVRKRDDADLYLVGSGALKEKLKAQVESSEIKKRVKFIDRQAHTEIPYWMSASDVFCLPSRNEGCPNVVVEALASGRPVVASNVGGIPELIRPENGILFPSENSKSLADALNQALNRKWDPSTLRSSVEYLSWDAVGDAYYKVLESAVH